MTGQGLIMQPESLSPKSLQCWLQACGTIPPSGLTESPMFRSQGGKLSKWGSVKISTSPSNSSRELQTLAFWHTGGRSGLKRPKPITEVQAELTGADGTHNLNTRSLLSFPHNSLLAAKPVSQQNSKENSRGQFKLMWARPKKKTD